MVRYNLKNFFYSVKISYIFNFLFGLTLLDIIIIWLPNRNIKEYESQTLILSLIMFIFIGILPALSYNLIRFRMVKSGELNYGIWRYAISAILPFIAPMLIYGIAWLNGFRL